MESKAFIISLEKNPSISVKVIPGHFTTSSAHLSHYLDVSGLKSNAMVARDIAREMATPYLSSTLVETIVCMEKTEVIGAFLAQELLQSGMSAINGGSGEIHVVSPISNSLGQLSFNSSTMKVITNRSVILLVASVSGGRTLDSTLDCMMYYNAKIAGISALFMASTDPQEQDIHTLFTSADIPGYRFFSSRKCEMCQEGQKLDALISSEGYTKI